MGDLFVVVVVVVPSLVLKRRLTLYGDVAQF